MTDRCWALVPVKSRTQCKGRLAGALTAEARLSLVRFMLEHVLNALADSRTVDRIAVVSPERDAVPPDIAVLGDDGCGLNEALHAARQTLIERGATEIVVLPADLPLATAADIDEFVHVGRRSGLALVTDTAGTGTNALYLTPATGFRFKFGPGSRHRHIAEALRLGLKPELLPIQGLEFDVDEVEDLVRLRACADSPCRSLPPIANGGSWPIQTPPD